VTRTGDADMWQGFETNTREWREGYEGKKRVKKMKKWVGKEEKQINVQKRQRKA